MYLSTGEKIAKWTLLAVILLGICLPFLQSGRGLLNNIFSFVTILSSFTFFIALIGWFMVCFEKKAGKHLIFLSTVPMALTYGIAALYFFFVSPFMLLMLLLPLSICIVILWLQHIWTRYIF